MKYLKNLSNGSLHEEWNTNIHSYENDIEDKKRVLEFMYELSSVKTSDKIYWYTPYTIKHVAENWLKNKYGSRPYVCRDLCTSFAIALGQPVDLQPNANHNLIGLSISRLKFDNLQMNVNSNHAVDLNFAAQHSYENYALQSYKKTKQTNGQ